jgi:integrase
LTLPGGKQRAVYGRTKAEALQKLQDAQQQVRQGLPLPRDRVTVRSFLEGWLRDTVPYRVRPRTAHRYAEIVNLHLIPHLGHIRLSRLTPSDVEKALHNALTAGQSPRSVIQHRAVLRSALTQAVRDGLAGRNAAALAQPPHVPEQEHDAITPNRARAVLGTVRGDRLEALYMLLLAVGLRAGEALGLRWDDVDLDAGTIAVRRTLQRIDGEWCFQEPKTKRSRRAIPIPACAMQALREHCVRQTEERLKIGVAWQGEAWGALVFTNEKGGPLHISTAHHHFQELLVQAGLPRMRLHDLRHGAASLMAALGVPPRVAMEFLGHSQITITMDVYTHITSEHQREAARLLDDILWDSTPAVADRGLLASKLASVLKTENYCAT